MDNLLDDIAGIYETNIIDAGKQSQLLILLSFLTTFLLVRLLVHRIRSGHSRFHNLDRGGLHVHHLVWGIMLLLLTGFLTISYEPGWPWRPLLAILFGVGAALTLDEFALWLHLQDVYWAKEGRQSVDAVIIATTLIVVGLVSNAFLWSVVKTAFGIGGLETDLFGLGAEGGSVARVLGVVYPIVGAVTLVGMWKMFKKAGRRGWYALVPVLNLITLLHMAGRRAWWAILFVIPITGIFVSVLIGQDLAHRFERSRRFGLGLGLLPPVFYLLVGYGNDHYHAPQAASAPPTAATVQTSD